jgi:amino-acid N-acetyltransferase
MSDRFSRVVRAARTDDLPSMQSLLQDSALPIDGVAEHLDAFLVAEHEGALHGVVGLERYGDAALLRSLVVHEEARGTGLGAQLVQAIESVAEQHGVHTLVLLTTTAAAWFPRFGFARTTREAVPPSVTASVEFQGACPASATVMQKALHTP